MTAVAVKAPRKERKRAWKARRIDPAKVTELHKKGLTQAEIAQHQGVDQSTIYRFLQRTQGERLSLDIFKEQRADVFAGLQCKAISVQHKIIDAIDKDARDGILCTLKPSEKATLLNALNAVQGTIFDKERLERGESTSNVSLVSRMINSSVSSVHVRKSLNTQPVAIDDSSASQLDAGSTASEPAVPLSQEGERVTPGGRGAGRSKAMKPGPARLKSHKKSNQKDPR